MGMRSVRKRFDACKIVDVVGGGHYSSFIGRRLNIEKEGT
jgi:hypothetical protein